MLKLIVQKKAIFHIGKLRYEPIYSASSILVVDKHAIANEVATTTDRIVTIWNAMDGLSNEEVVKLRESREELLAALKDMKSSAENRWRPLPVDSFEKKSLNKAITAINNASK